MTSHWTGEPELLHSLDTAVPEILASQKANGQFGTKPWICTDQNVLLALAAAWSLKESLHFRSEQVLGAIARGGDALVDAQDEHGMFTFRKKDHSTWGQIFMPWLYSRWIRAYGIVRDGLDHSTRERWDAALQKGYEGISSLAMHEGGNIPAHHAMGLYAAGAVFGRADWQQQASEFMCQIASEQSEYGWWAEHKGPVGAYNFVYVEALGVYWSMSGDEVVLEALRRAARYHAGCTYPDGSLVETIDGRNPYLPGIRLGNAGFCHSAEGRGFLARQHELYLARGGKFDADYAAQILLYGGEGEIIESAGSRERHTYRMGDHALMRRKKPWFVSLSAFTADIPRNRWGLDRQNFVSVFHDGIGLIVGGGNTKLQPLWSTFTVGDVALLKHKPGDENPGFSPRDGLIHVPDRAKILEEEDRATLMLGYGETSCNVTVQDESETEISLVLTATEASAHPVEAHVTLIPHLGKGVKSAVGSVDALGEEAFEWRNPEWIEHAGWRLTVPEGARLVWPALPHNAYRKDGAATAEEGRLVVVVVFDAPAKRQELRLHVG